ncbi:YfcE family phosphodiesterase [Candidatus Bipolaricaulota bacterium]|nr:YfcE family phosphodiesterase [Candidatus Bipolaricaulota bacterium]
MRIGLVSDTHVPSQLTELPPKLLEELRGVDAILHAGDLVSIDVLDLLNAIAPTTAVAGNMDPEESVRILGREKVIGLDGRTIGLKHGDQSRSLQDRYIGLSYDAPEFELFFQAMAARLPDAEIIVFGHFHAPLIRRWHDRLFVNPGAVAPSHGRSSLGVLTLEASGAEVRIVDLQTTPSAG